MKGRKLSLQEVLNLDDGTKVWVEELNDIKMSALHIVDGNYLNDEEKDEAYCFDDIELYYMDELEFYEWIEEFSYSKTLESVQNIMKEIQYDAYLPLLCQTEIKTETPLHKMAQEICNLRGLDLTDDNIRLIVEEFMEEK